MRRLTVRSLAVIAVLVSGTSQLAAQAPFVAFSVGGTLSDFGGVDASSKGGMTAGATVGFRNWGYLGANLEANWIQKGGANTQLGYIELPLLIGVGTRGDLRARIYSGIAIAFDITCGGVASVEGMTCARTKSPEWAWPIGVQAGRDIQAGTFVGLDVRYSIALSDTFEGLPAYNRTWQFRAYVGKWIE